jgi:guanylate kinase
MDMPKKMPKKLITLTGPTGTGKSQMAQMLVERGFAVAMVTTTTRAPREGEVDGKHYYFASAGEFDEMVGQNEFIEWAWVGEGEKAKRYGSTRAEAERLFALGKPVVMVCEPNGAKNIHDYATSQGWECTRVFLDNPLEILAERFLRRFQTDSKATVADYAQRMAHMFTAERDQWVKPAHDGSAAYEVVAPEFTERTEEAVLEQIVKVAGIAPKKTRRLAAR